MLGILAEKCYPLKLEWSALITQRNYLRSDLAKKGSQSYCPHTLKSHKFIEPDEAGPVYLVEI